MTAILTIFPDAKRSKCRDFGSRTFGNAVRGTWSMTLSAGELA